MYSFYIDVNLFAYVFENPSTSTHCWADWPNDRTGTELYATNHFRTLDENYLIFFENRKLRSRLTAIPAIYEWETEEGNIYGAFSNYFSIDIERSSWKIWKTKNLSKLSMTTETQHRKVERRSHDIIKWKKSTFSCLRNFTTFLVLAPMKNKIWKKSILYSARHLNPTFLYGGFFKLNEVTRAK